MSNLIIEKRSIALDKAIIKSHVNEKKEPSHSDENEINQNEQTEAEFKTDMVERFKIWLAFILFIYINAIFV